MTSSKFIHPRNDLQRRHERPFLAIFWQHREGSVAPRTAIVAAARAYENRRMSDQGAFSLNGRPEDLAYSDTFRHGRHSAQVRGVSQTRTATTSGQRDLHQS